MAGPDPKRVASAYLQDPHRSRDADEWQDTYASLYGDKVRAFERVVVGHDASLAREAVALVAALKEVEREIALAARGGRSKTAGEVRFIKDRGGDKNEWAWATPGPLHRDLGEFKFRQNLLKPLSACLRATLMAMGHALSANNTFAKIKSADLSPDGALGGKGYIQKISDIRRAYMNVVEALSAVSDTLYDEIKAPHWHPDAEDGGPREREEVKTILQDVEEVRQDPEGWAEKEEEEGTDAASEDFPDASADDLAADEANPPMGLTASANPRSKRAALRVASSYLTTSTTQGARR